jgi:hypothetical protein
MLELLRLGAELGKTGVYSRTDALVRAIGDFA